MFSRKKFDILRKFASKITNKTEDHTATSRKQLLYEFIKLTEKVLPEFSLLPQDFINLGEVVLQDLVITLVDFINLEDYVLGNLPNFTYRRPIVIVNATSQDLYDYQVLVTLDTQSLIASGKMREDGGDIRFTDADGLTLIPYWVEGGLNTSTTQIWVKVPHIPANSTKRIFLYYGNPDATSLSSVTDTFIREIPNLVMALQLNEGAGNVAYDTSGNNAHGNVVGATWVEEGKWDACLTFDGVDDYVEVTSSVVNNTIAGLSGVYTFVVWAYFSNNNKVRHIFQRGSNYDRHGLALSSTNRVVFSHYSGSWFAKGTTTSFSAGWHHIALVYNTIDNITIYVDNTSYSSAYSYIYGYPYTNLQIGRNAYYDLTNFDDKLDEIFLFNRALSAEEISDMYQYYPFATTNYPGKVLVRKRVIPDPVVYVGSEEVLSGAQNTTTIGDILSLADLVSYLIDKRASITDTITLIDAVLYEIHQTLSQQVIDTLSLYDAVSYTIDYNLPRTVTDFVSVNDSVLVDVKQKVTDTISVSDSVSTNTVTSDTGAFFFPDYWVVFNQNYQTITVDPSALFDDNTSTSFTLYYTPPAPSNPREVLLGYIYPVNLKKFRLYCTAATPGKTISIQVYDYDYNLIYQTTVTPQVNAWTEVLPPTTLENVMEVHVTVDTTIVGFVTLAEFQPIG